MKPRKCFFFLPFFFGFLSLLLFPPPPPLFFPGQNPRFKQSLNISQNQLWHVLWWWSLFLFTISLRFLLWELVKLHNNNKKRKETKGWKGFALVSSKTLRTWSISLKHLVCAFNHVSFVLIDYLFCLNGSLYTGC